LVRIEREPVVKRIEAAAGHQQQAARALAVQQAPRRMRTLPRSWR
jgi:hypothetical protein